MIRRHTRYLLGMHIIVYSFLEFGGTCIVSQLLVDLSFDGATLCPTGASGDAGDFSN